MLQKNMACHILFIHFFLQQVVLCYIFIADSSNMFYKKEKYFLHDGKYSVNSNMLDKVVATNLSNCIEICDLYHSDCAAINVFQFSNGYKCEFLANSSDMNELIQNGNSTHLSKSRVIFYFYRFSYRYFPRRKSIKTQKCLVFLLRKKTSFISSCFFRALVIPI